jgi:hypothetical protein
VHEQGGEERALPRRAQLDRLAVARGGERAEDAELECWADSGPPLDRI